MTGPFSKLLTGSRFGSSGNGGKFGTSGWGHSKGQISGTKDPHGTHKGTCVAENATEWSYSGRLPLMYDDTCPGCRWVRAHRGFWSESQRFGGKTGKKDAENKFVIGGLYENKGSSIENGRKKNGFKHVFVGSNDRKNVPASVSLFGSSHFSQSAFNTSVKAREVGKGISPKLQKIETASRLKTNQSSNMSSVGTNQLVIKSSRGCEKDLCSNGCVSSSVESSGSSKHMHQRHVSLWGKSDGPNFGRRVSLWEN